jgi:RHS repeat-associated protein
LAACNLNFISLWDIFKIYNDSKRSLLKDINKNIDGYDIRFRSREYSSNQPYLEVTYTLTMKKYYYIKDHLGSIRSVINESGIVVESNDYYPFGLKMPGRSYVSGTPSRNLFTGKERDDETGWDYFGARYYDPAIGRWMVVDPLADKAPDMTPYHYCQNNPLNRIDPDGKWPPNPHSQMKAIAKHYGAPTTWKEVGEQSKKTAIEINRNAPKVLDPLSTTCNLAGSIPSPYSIILIGVGVGAKLLSGGSKLLDQGLTGNNHTNEIIGDAANVAVGLTIDPLLAEAVEFGVDQCFSDNGSNTNNVDLGNSSGLAPADALNVSENVNNLNENSYNNLEFIQFNDNDGRRVDEGQIVTYDLNYEP